MAQKFFVGFCIVSPNLFSEVLDVRVKRNAESSTDLRNAETSSNVVVCSLRFSKPWLNRKSRRSRVAFRINGRPWRIKMSGNSLHPAWQQSSDNFQRFLRTFEMEWSLFRTATISSAVESCGRKRLIMAAVSEK